MPRGYDPHRRPAAPRYGESTPIDAGTPQDTCTQSIPHSLPPGPGAPGGTPGGLVTSPRSRTPLPLCGDRPVAGQTGQRPGPARTDSDGTRLRLSQVEGMHRKWREAIAGEGERSQVEGSNREWRGAIAG